MSTLSSVCLPIALCTLSAALVQAQPPIPLGSEFQVNTTTTNRQHQPDVSVAADGSFVVVWAHGTADYGPGADARDIRGQRYDPSGVTVGSEFEVMEFSPQDQFDPSVDMNALGRFVVIWIEATSAQYRTEVRRFNSDGTPNGNEMKINTTGNDQFHESPDVAMLSDGDSVATWSFSPLDVVRGRIIDPAGNPFPPITELFINNTVSQRIQGSSVGASESVSRFVAAWASTEGADEDRIRARLFDADGVASGLDFQVNTNTTADQTRPSVAVDGTGSFVVVWTDGANAVAGQDGLGMGVRAQRFDVDGMFLGSEFQVNSYTTGNQRYPNVGISAAGDFVVTWVSEGSDGTDTDSWSIQARHFGPDGTALGPDFQVNTYTTGGVTNPSVGQSLEGNFVITWDDGFNSPQQDGDSSGIFAQRYRSGLGPIFVDGFESGDMSSWSSSAP